MRRCMCTDVQELCHHWGYVSLVVRAMTRRAARLDHAQQHKTLALQTKLRLRTGELTMEAQSCSAVRAAVPPVGRVQCRRVSAARMMEA